MSTLPFEQLNYIKAQLSDDLLEHLAAVFSQRKNGDLLLVYLVEAMPPTRPESSRAMTLDELRYRDLRAYDGPVVAFSAVDAIRPDLPTAGPDFYELNHLLQERGLFDLARRTSAELSACLLGHLDEPAPSQAGHLRQQQLSARIIACATPALLARLPLADLVAILPDSDLNAYVKEQACRLVYRKLPATGSLPPAAQLCTLQELQTPGFVSPTDWIIALEEVGAEVRPQSPVEDESFLELRAMLRRGGLEAALNETLGALAADFYRRWAGAPDNIPYLQTAYALALERWLAGADVDDLVAVLPCDNFERFAADGAAIYLYRQLAGPIGPESRSDAHRLSLQDWQAIDRLPAEFGHVAFSLLPLRRRLQVGGVQLWGNLGPVLHKAGQTDALARSAWLLVRDMMDWPRERLAACHISLTELSQAMSHTCTLFSLNNPWRQRQGRHSQMLLGSWQTLMAILDKQAQAPNAPERLYYQALGIWYRCLQVTAPEIEPALNRMIELLREFEQENRRQPGVNQGLRAQADYLQRIGSALLLMLGGGGQPKVIRDLYPARLKRAAGSVRQALRLAADMSSETELPSLFFRNAFQQYAGLMEKEQRIRTSQIPLEDKIAQLHFSVAELERAQRMVFALHHEKRVLDLLYERAIQQTRTRADELQGSAQLVVQLQTALVLQHEDNVLTFLVRNIGRGEAKRVKVQLMSSEFFGLNEESSVKRLASLPPDDETRFDFTIRPLVDDDCRVGLRISYSDPRAESQMHQAEFLVQVTGLDRGPFLPKPNPYIYGVPLQNYQLFYGRRQELKSLLNHLASGGPQDFLLRGARRTGKTSVLNMVKAILDDRSGQAGSRAWFEVPAAWYGTLDAFWPILLDLQSIERQGNALTSTAFYQAILTGLIDSGLGNAQLESLLAEPNLTTLQFERVLAATLQENSGMRLALLVDEFDLVDLIVDKAFYAHLRHVISRVQSIVWIITSALGLYKEVRDYESPLFNVFKIIDLGRLDRESARRLILDPWTPRNDQTPQERATLQFVDDAVEVILHETGRHPYFIQLLASAVVEHVNIKRTNYVLRRTVYEVIEKLVTPRSAAYEHFAYLWDRAGGMGKMILLLLLQRVEAPGVQELWQVLFSRLETEQSQLPPTWLAAEYENSLRRLESVEAIAYNNRRHLVFGIPLFRRLLARRSEREELWAIARQELHDDFVKEMIDAD